MLIATSRTRLAQLERSREESEHKIKQALKEAACEIPISVVLGLERLVGVRARLQEAKPQTRAEVFHRWLNEVVKPGRVVGVGRAGRRLVMVTEKRDGSIRGFREDGSSASFPQERIGRVYSPVYRLREEDVEKAFEEIRKRGKELTLVEPRLRDAYAEETDALKIVDDSIENLLPPHITRANSDARKLSGNYTQRLKTTNAPRAGSKRCVKKFGFRSNSAQEFSPCLAISITKRKR